LHKMECIAAYILIINLGAKIYNFQSDISARFLIGTGSKKGNQITNRRGRTVRVLQLIESLGLIPAGLQIPSLKVFFVVQMVKFPVLKFIKRG
jgi:hypothetical protein